MNLNVPVDLRENITITTDTYPSVDELLAAVCDYPFLTNIIIEQTLPQLRKFAEVNYGCELSLKYFLYHRRTCINRGTFKTRFWSEKRC